MKTKERTTYVRLFFWWEKNLHNTWIRSGWGIIQTIDSKKNFFRRDNSKVKNFFIALFIFTLHFLFFMKHFPLFYIEFIWLFINFFTV